MFLVDSDSQEVRVSSSSSTDLSLELRLVLSLEHSAFAVKISGSLVLDEGLKKFLIVIGGLKAFFSSRPFTGVESSIVAGFDLSVNIGIITGAIPNLRFTLFYKKKIR